MQKLIDAVNRIKEKISMSTSTGWWKTIADYLLFTHYYQQSLSA